MKVEISRSGISSVANIGDHISAPHLFSLRDPICIARQMGIVINVSVRWIDLIEGYSSPLAWKEPDHSAISRGKNRQTLLRHYVDGIVASRFAARLVESVAQLVGFHALPRHQEISCCQVVKIRLGDRGDSFHG